MKIGTRHRPVRGVGPVMTDRFWFQSGWSILASLRVLWTPLPSMIRRLHGDPRGFGRARGPKEVRREPHSKILQGPSSRRGDILLRDAPLITKMALLRQVTAGMHASRRQLTTRMHLKKTQSLTHQWPLHLILSSSNNCHVYYWLTGQNKEDNPKTCPHDHKMAGMCADRRTILEERETGESSE